MKRWFAGLAVAFALSHARAHAAPQRIVSLLPSLTETVCVLGHCGALVGVDDFSNWPEQVQRLPHVGGLEDANIERIVALKPDLVLLSASSRAGARLQSLGITVLAMEPRTLEDVHTALDRVGAALGETQAASRVWAELQAGIDRAARSVPPARKGERVYFEVDSGPYAAGPGSHIGELLTRLGVSNIVPASLGSVPKLNPEFIVRADPQLIFIAARDAAEMRTRPGWDRISAIRDGHVCALDRRQGDVVVRPGPRLAEAARILAQCIAR
jgi:iron complex transport system substrate-binding protein